MLWVTGFPSGGEGRDTSYASKRDGLPFNVTSPPIVVIAGLSSGRACALRTSELAGCSRLTRAAAMGDDSGGAGEGIATWERGRWPELLGSRERARRQVPHPRVNARDLPVSSSPGRGHSSSDVGGGRRSTLWAFQD
jgi:hypothetical protein